MVIERMNVQYDRDLHGTLAQELNIGVIHDELNQQAAKVEADLEGIAPIVQRSVEARQGQGDEDQLIERPPAPRENQSEDTDTNDGGDDQPPPPPPPKRNCADSGQLRKRAKGPQPKQELESHNDSGRSTHEEEPRRQNYPVQRQMNGVQEVAFISVAGRPRPPQRLNNEGNPGRVEDSPQAPSLRQRRHVYAIQENQGVRYITATRRPANRLFQPLRKAEDGVGDA
jgi:hypothetical protein